MADQTQASSGGIGFFGLLGITFVVLKLTHVIDWSWWLVTAPFWGPVAAVLAFVIGITIFGIFKK